MARRTRAATDRTSPPPFPVVTRHALEELHPSRHDEALRLSRVGTANGMPDTSRIRVLGPGSFEVMPVGWEPPAPQRRRRTAS